MALISKKNFENSSWNFENDDMNVENYDINSENYEADSENNKISLENRKGNLESSEANCQQNTTMDCQTHVHEYLGSTTIFNQIPHNHRFAGVTGQAIPSGKSHVHQLLGNSDFAESHLHEVGATTGPAIPVGKGRHIHFVYGTTTLNRGHVHQFIFATLIDEPIDK